MIRRVAALLFLLFLAAPAAGWGTTKGVFSDPSKPVKVRKGQDFILALGSNPTTGYSWEIVPPPDATRLKFIGQNFQREKQAAVGQGGVEWFRFLALKEGDCDVLLRYRRPWEKGVPPAKEARFKIQIGP